MHYTGTHLALPAGMKLTSTALTHVGRRSNNEDNLCHDAQLGLFAVADGMGGYEGGEIASQIAIDTVREFIRRNERDRDVTWPYALDMHLSLRENMASTAVRLAHDHIALRRTGTLAQMGSTLAMMLASPDRAVIAHIGDSRIYRLRDRALAQLTVDHSLYEELVAAGTPDLPPRASFQFTNMITRALGISGAADVATIDVAPGDVYLLCTDGLSEMVDEARMARVLCSEPLDTACQTLVRAAYDAGGRDNITAVLVHCAA